MGAQLLKPEKLSFLALRSIGSKNPTGRRMGSLEFTIALSYLISWPSIINFFGRIHRKVKPASNCKSPALVIQGCLIHPPQSLRNIKLPTHGEIPRTVDWSGLPADETLHAH